MQSIQFPWMIGAAARSHYLVTHPDAEPYYDRRMLGVLNDYISVFLVVTVILTVIGFRLRGSAGAHRLYLHVVNQSWWLSFAWLAYLHGLATPPLWAIYPFVGFFCLLLFDARLTAAGVLSSLAFMYTATVLERLGHVPYAPLFRGSPMVDGRIADPWLYSSM